LQTKKASESDLNWSKLLLLLLLLLLQAKSISFFLL
jgi:hypothetical protein